MLRSMRLFIKWIVLVLHLHTQTPSYTHTHTNAVFYYLNEVDRTYSHHRNNQLFMCTKIFMLQYIAQDENITYTSITKHFDIQCVFFSWNCAYVLHGYFPIILRRFITHTPRHTHKSIFVKLICSMINLVEPFQILYNIWNLYLHTF